MADRPRRDNVNYSKGRHSPKKKAKFTAPEHEEKYDAASAPAAKKKPTQPLLVQEEPAAVVALDESLPLPVAPQTAVSSRKQRKQAHEQQSLPVDVSSSPASCRRRTPEGAPQTAVFSKLYGRYRDGYNGKLIFQMQ